ncbi:MAG: hypothetical protein LBM98_00980 [Oscillospiraceae bacterium]|jgi:hypothetical protein|nr:hypothetical protein [Oscillospiraceae bacterium]
MINDSPINHFPLEQYTKVDLKNGQVAVLVEVLEKDGIYGYIAEVKQPDGDYEIETVYNTEIEAVYYEVKAPLYEVLRLDNSPLAVAI